MIVPGFLNFCFSESFLLPPHGQEKNTFLPLTVIAQVTAQGMKRSVGREIFARLKKTPFTLTNDGLYLLSIPLMCQ